MIFKAPAKINLSLDVIGRRPNGYHDLRMIMQSINLNDVLHFEKKQEANIYLEMNKSLPDNCPMEKNLVYRAARLMFDKYRTPGGLNIYLEKNIPAAAGLAGGSTDCATTLIAINQIYELGLDIESLCELGLQLGADVPFCIKKGTMLAEGIGEKLKRLTDLPKCHILLIKPDISVSTAFVYGNLKLDEDSIHPETDLMIKDIERKDLASLCKKLSNILESVTIPKYPILSEIKTFLKDNHAIGVLMSGSGPTVYGIYQDEINCTMAYKKALESYPNFDIIKTNI